eukprot:g1108.t1
MPVVMGGDGGGPGVAAGSFKVRKKEDVFECKTKKNPTTEACDRSHSASQSKEYTLTSAFIFGIVDASVLHLTPHLPATLTSAFIFGIVDASVLHLTPHLPATLAPRPQIFVYDEFCRDIVTPLLTVSDLRDCGVTLHMTLHSKRERISDVSAVYFVEPTEENVRRIAEDCENDLYGSYYLNFVSSLPRPLLENLAQRTLAKGRAARVAKVVDQHLQFVALETDMFTLNLRNTFSSYFDRTATEKSIETKMEQIASGLFSAMVTMRHVPIIQCPKGGAAEAVARRLEKMIRYDLNTSDSLFEGSEQLASASSALLGRRRGVDGADGGGGGGNRTSDGSGASHRSADGGDDADVDGSLFGAQRPLLLLIERSTDLVAVMRHSIVYQDLVHDLLDGCELNRVTFTNSRTGEKETCALDPEHDPFWAEHAGDEFHVAVKVNNSELQALNAKVDRLQRLATQQARNGAPPADAASSGGGGGDSKASELASAVESLPQLLKRKKQLTQHTSILEALMDQIDKRNIHEFYKAEDAVLSNPSKPPEGLRGLMTRGHLQDRLRLLCICATLGALDEIGLSDALGVLKMSLREEADGGETGATSEGNDAPAATTATSTSSSVARSIVAAEKVVKFLTQQQREKAMMKGGGASKREEKSSRRGSHAGTVLSDLWSKGVAELSQRLGTGSSHNTTVAEKVLNACCNASSSRMAPGEAQIRKNVCCFDPRSDPDSSRSPRRSLRAPFRSAIVFVIGGGSTSELHALRGWEKRDEMRSVVYGSTELVNASSILDQIASLR